MDVSKSRYRDFVWTVELHQFCLEIVGLWPKTNEVGTSNFASDLRIGIAIVINFLTIIPLICSLIRVWGDMTLMIENLQITLPLLMISMKIVIMRWKRTAVATVIKMMEEDWMELKDDIERNVMMKRARIARLFVIFGYIVVVSAFTVLIVLPPFGIPFRHMSNLTDGARMLPLPAYYFYDTDKSPQYELTLTIQALTMFFDVIVYTFIDTFLGLVVFHICGQLENFKRRLANLVRCKNYNYVLYSHIETHLRLIRFADNVEDIFSFILLGLVFLFGIVFCIYGFLFCSVFTDDGMSNMPISQIYFVIIGGITLLAHTFLYCGAGEIIAEQCEAVYRTICDLQWYKLEYKSGKMLILLMIRANEPFRITAGRIIPLTMTTFCSLLKTSVGYISILLAKRE